MDLFATRFNNNYIFVSPVPDPQARAVETLSLPWEDLDPTCLPTSSLLGQVVEKLQDHPCNRLLQGGLPEALDFLDCLPVGLGFRQAKGEIHAWLHNNFRHQSFWSMVSLYPSASLLSKNQLAKESPDSVAPVVNAALAPLWIRH